MVAESIGAGDGCLPNHGAKPARGIQAGSRQRETSHGAGSYSQPDPERAQASAPAETALPHHADQRDQGDEERQKHFHADSFETASHRVASQRFLDQVGSSQVAETNSRLSGNEDRSLTASPARIPPTRCAMM